MVNLTRIYTRTGDDGTTALGDMSRALKTDLRLEAFADVDEAEKRALSDLSKIENFSPMLAILSSRHEMQYSRLFRS